MGLGARQTIAITNRPHHVKTPVLDGREWRRLLDAIPTETVRDLRDRALIATLSYSLARITAALKMRVEDLRPRGAGGKHGSKSPYCAFLRQLRWSR